MNIKKRMIPTIETTQAIKKSGYALDKTKTRIKEKSSKKSPADVAGLRLTY